MRGLRQFLSGTFFTIVTIIAFIVKAVFFLVAMIFALLWGLLWLVSHFVRLPSPRYRREYRCRKFEEAVKRARADGQSKRDAMSHQSSRENLSELADLVFHELDLRKREIAPNIYEMTRGSIQSCIEKANIRRIELYYKIIQNTETERVNQKLMKM